MNAYFCCGAGYDTETFSFGVVRSDPVIDMAIIFAETPGKARGKFCRECGYEFMDRGVVVRKIWAGPHTAGWLSDDDPLYDTLWDFDVSSAVALAESHR